MDTNGHEEEDQEGRKDRSKPRMDTNEHEEESQEGRTDRIKPRIHTDRHEEGRQERQRKGDSRALRERDAVIELGRPPTGGSDAHAATPPSLRSVSGRR